MLTAHDSIAQPIICCVGPRIAGQPTQFLLERAFANLRLDWRAFSVAVAPDRLAAACDGMLAMGFKGLRLFADFQTQGVDVLAAHDSACRFVGSVTSAAPAADGWRAWDNLGHAWIERLQDWAEDQRLLIWLHGDSRSTRSVLAAVLDNPPGTIDWLWTEPSARLTHHDWPTGWDRQRIEPRLVPHGDRETIASTVPWLLSTDSSTMPIQIPVDAPGGDSGEIAASARQRAEATAALQSTARVGLITDQTELPQDMLQLMAQLPVHWAVGPAMTIPPQLRSSGVQRVSLAELIVAGEAHDFQLWTGQTVDRQVLQDAYDEYCDF